MKIDIFSTILLLLLGRTFAASDKANFSQKTVDPWHKQRELSSVWSSFLNLIHPPNPMHHSIAANNTDLSMTESAQNISSSSSMYSDEISDYATEDQNDSGGTTVSSISSASAWMYVAAGAVLLSLLGVAYRKRREEDSVVAKVNLMDEESASTVEVEIQRKKAWWHKFRLRKKQQTDVHVVSV